MKEYTIQGNDAGQRFDKYLAKRLPEAPKSFYYKMLRKKNITLNRKRAEGKEILAEGDRVQFFLSDETFEKFSSSAQIRTSHHTLDVLFENEDVILINKPAGMLSQPDGSGKASLTEYLSGYLLESGALRKADLETFHPGVCNRLDRNTSGIITAGKSLYGLQELSRMFREREVSKYYLCICEGVIREPSHLKGYLSKDDKTNRVKVLERNTEGASRIETKYRPLGDNGRQTLLEVELLTGKPHQIRAHLASEGHAILGDAKYGRKDPAIPYQLLHACRLVFPDMEGRLAELSGKVVLAQLPNVFWNTLKKLHLEEYYEREGRNPERGGK